MKRRGEKNKKRIPGRVHSLAVIITRVYCTFRIISAAVYYYNKKLYVFAGEKTALDDVCENWHSTERERESER